MVQCVHVFWDSEISRDFSKISRQVFSPHSGFPASTGDMYYVDCLLYFMWIIEFVSVYLYSCVNTCTYQRECVLVL